MDTLRNYTFLPWLRQGIASAISVDDRLGEGSGASPERAGVSVGFRVNGEPVARDVQLLGPGDVVGINPRAIIKTEPRDRITDFESNYLPYVEFYEEDFPWRFTPARAVGELGSSRLRPWIFLVVLEEAEFVENRASQPLPSFEIAAETDPVSVFPDPTQSWAWAHVHVQRNIAGDQLQTTTAAQVEQSTEALEALVRSNPDNASSRLLCPRKLRENTAYHAFLVPAFEVGRLAGLGQDIPSETDGQQASWGAGQRIFPIYFQWSFRTGLKGDFEFLVDLLEPRPVDGRVGVRSMDTTAPGYEVTGMVPPFDVMGLEGALRSPQTRSFPQTWPPENTDFDNPAPGSAGDFLNQLEQKVNLQFDLQQAETDDPHPDPIVSPPLYGQWYAQVEKLDVRSGSGWVDALNRDPRLRTPAGFGTQVVQGGQESFMQQAWAQLGDLLRTNQRIRQLQLGWMATFTMYRKHVLPQTTDQVMSFTQAVHARVLGSPTTIAQQVKVSRLPRAALDPAFRKVARRRGAILRRVEPDTQKPLPPLVSQLNSGTLTAAPPRPDPTGQLSLDTVAEAVDAPDIPESLRRLIRSGVIRWLLAALALVALALMPVFGAFFILGAIAAAAVGGLVYVERLRRQILVAESFRESAFTPQTVAEIPARANFVVTEFEQPLSAAAPAGGPAGGQNGESVDAANFRTALQDAFNVYQTPPPEPPPREPMDLEKTALRMKASINPAVTIPRRAEFFLKIPERTKAGYLRPNKTLVQVMAHPVFPDPMYRPLRDISADLLLPNLNLIPNNTISLMETNPRFIEAYMVGLNHEMGRELLWREFPTDQRGSYFRQFWDVADAVSRESGRTPAEIEESLRDITRLHTWGRDSALGTHENRPLPTGAEPGDARLVLVIRGDLLKKYPTAVIYAQKAKWAVEDGRQVRVLEDANPEANLRDPIFKAEIEPEIRFLGFDLTASEVRGNPDPEASDPGWFFVIQERPGEPRFGLDNLSGDPLEPPFGWNDVAWEHLPNFEGLGVIDFRAGAPDLAITASPDQRFQWGRNAADMAYILYQVPVMVAFHAADMLQPASS